MKVLDQMQPHQKAPTRTRRSSKPRSTSAPAQTVKLAGMVYLLKAGPFYKIGKTTDFDRRLQQIKLHLPYSVEVVHTISALDITVIELFWHKKFAHWRANGEWFTLNDAEVAAFKSYSFM